MTSTSGSRLRSRSSPASDSGIACRVASASGTRISSDWAPCTDPPCCQVRGAHPKSDHRTHEDARPSRHQVHSPHATEHDDSTRSPGEIAVTSGPTSSTVPMNSWPSREPAGKPNASPAL